MITIWKLTIFTFRLGIPKFLKFNFTIFVDRNEVIKLHKSVKSNVEIAKRLDMNRSTVWKIMKKLQKTGNTLDRPGRGRKRSVCSPQLLKNTNENLRRNLHQSCSTLGTTPSVRKSTLQQVLRDDREVKPFKMLHRQELKDNHVVMRVQNIQGNSSEDGRRHAAEPRVHGCEEFRHPAGDKPAKW